MSERFLIVLLALAPIDVVDLAGGTLGFHLSPFLLGSLLYVVFIVFSGLAKPVIKIRKSFVQQFYLPMLFIFSMILSSVFCTEDPLQLSYKRILLTSWLIVFSIIVTRQANMSLFNVFAKATTLYILFDSAFVVLQCIYFYFNLNLLQAFDAFITIEPRFGAGLPRFNGLVADANRAAIDLVLMLGLSYYFGKQLTKYKIPIWVMLIGLLLVLCTVSRTGLVALTILFLIVLLDTRKDFSALVILTLCCLCFIVLCIFVIPYLPLLTYILLSSSDRLISTATHFDLYVTAHEVFFDCVKNFLFGVGWGTEYVYTQDFLGILNKYGNFHSGYTSVAVQTGIVGLVVYLAYLIRPMFSRHYSFQHLVWVLIWANIFYQYHAEPMFWVILALLNIRYIEGWQPGKNSVTCYLSTNQLYKCKAK